MRDPNRITAVMDKLKKIWTDVPDWRLGQLIVNLSRSGGCSNPFFLEDDKLLDVMDSIIEADKPGERDAIPS